MGLEELKNNLIKLNIEIQESQIKLLEHDKKLSEAKRLSSASFHGLNDWHARSCFSRMVNGLEKQKIPLESKFNTLCDSKTILEAEVKALEDKRERQEAMIKEFILKTSITEENNIIENAVKYIRDTFDIFSVAIRVKEGKDFPYYSTIGFSDEFIKIENMLCCKNNKPECICGSVLTKVYKEKEWFTKKGSFWTNSITDLLSITDNGNNLGILAKLRGTCFKTGYESIAIIPILDRDKNIGLIQLNDLKKGKFTLATIEILETMAESLGCSIGVLDDGILAKLRKKELLKKSIISFQNDIKEIKQRK